MARCLYVRCVCVCALLLLLSRDSHTLWFVLLFPWLQIFFSVYEMAIDTVLLSFCEDCESNNGHPRCAPPLLLEAIGGLKPAVAAAPAAAPAAPAQPPNYSAYAHQQPITGQQQW